MEAAVAAAGVISGGPPLWETPDAQWDALFAVNVNGVRNLATVAVPALLAAPTPAAWPGGSGGVGGRPPRVARALVPTAPPSTQ